MLVSKIAAKWPINGVLKMYVVLSLASCPCSQNICGPQSTFVVCWIEIWMEATSSASHEANIGLVVDVSRQTACSGVRWGLWVVRFCKSHSIRVARRANVPRWLVVRLIYWHVGSIWRLKISGVSFFSWFDNQLYKLVQKRIKVTLTFFFFLENSKNMSCQAWILLHIQSQG